MDLSVTDLGALQPREKCNRIFEIRLAILTVKMTFLEVATLLTKPFS